MTDWTMAQAKADALAESWRLRHEARQEAAAARARAAKALRPPGYDPAPILAYFRGERDLHIARHLGVDHTTIGNWRSGARLMSSTADRVAIRLGLHPINIWPEWEVAA